MWHKYFLPRFSVYYFGHDLNILVIKSSYIVTYRNKFVQTYINYLAEWSIFILFLLNIFAFFSRLCCVLHVYSICETSVGYLHVNNNNSCRRGDFVSHLSYAQSVREHNACFLLHLLIKTIKCYILIQLFPRSYGNIPYAPSTFLAEI